MSSKTRLVLGILGAVAAGAVIGLLLAPEKGSDLRKKIKSTANDWASHLTDLFAAGKEQADDLKNKAAKGVKDLQKEAQETVNRATESFS